MKLGVDMVDVKEAGSGSGAPAKSAKSGDGQLCHFVCAQSLTRITSGDWRRGWLGTSKEVIEKCRHLGEMHKSSGS